jgi:hypothetical protein
MPPIPGSSLRDEIARMLRLKFHDVRVEHKLKTTTADVLFVDNTNQVFPQSIAIEAKDWGRPLTSDKLATIDNLYRPSINSGEIDALWIIGTHTLGSSPNDAVSKLYKVKYNTVDEFRASLINFHHLIRHNISEFTRDEAAKNFILTRDRASGGNG